MSRFKRTALSWTAIVAFVVGAQVYASRGLVSGSAPPIPSTTLDGRPFVLESLRGAPAAIYFWASWCGVCKAMQGTVASVARDHRVVGVALQSGDAGEVAGYLRTAGFPLDTVLDEDGSVGARYGLRGVPTLFILDREGRIRFSTSGYTSEAGLRLRLWLAGL